MGLEAVVTILSGEPCWQHMLGRQLLLPYARWNNVTQQSYKLIQGGDIREHSADSRLSQNQRKKFKDSSCSRLGCLISGGWPCGWLGIA